MKPDTLPPLPVPFGSSGVHQDEDAYSADQLREYARAAILAVEDAAQADWSKHPQAQVVIGSKARLEIEMSLIKDILNDPEVETTAMEMEYWHGIHDRIQALARAALASPPPAQSQEPT